MSAVTKINFLTSQIRLLMPGARRYDGSTMMFAHNWYSSSPRGYVTARKNIHLSLPSPKLFVETSLPVDSIISLDLTNIHTPLLKRILDTSMVNNHMSSRLIDSVGKIK
ncbi:hypothetical protein SARC_04562 [Sphaeroforma arctica JP610]|uniref:Uncharacterized protein n=1 Tax=Sphaeroforma arctica JP610 TaxID=667725 RepID=A0A0L0G2Y2_9EUKA|nr:hypothetical protein SARC_04562 [Sphaeroforma arctica JP610]KNC83176.1 hypothetical protein SARC_04562 [Sphaeroforma arctica JP610]|eukprot:XP_014157078.1 hypothetical protein SARC_04562 [Sphaeroforma arctica JP610]